MNKHHANVGIALQRACAVVRILIILGLLPVSITMLPPVNAQEEQSEQSTPPDPVEPAAYPQAVHTVYLPMVARSGAASADLPTISDFRAEPASILAGEAVVLHWSAVGADSLTLLPTVGTIPADTTSTGSLYPETTTTYTLQASNGAGETSATVTVIVTNPEPGEKPAITSFTAEPSTITAEETATLTWSARNATSLSISPDVGEVTGSSVQVAPAATTTYTLTATNDAGETSASVTVTVERASNSQNGFFVLRDYLTYNAATAVDAQGNAHLAFYLSDERHQDDPRGQPAYYAYCPGSSVDCTDPSNWSGLAQFSSQVSEVQIVATSDGKPRLLVRHNGSRGYEYEYWACHQQCTDAQNWAGVIAAQAAGVELWNTDMPQHSFALDSQGRPRFIYSNGWGNGRPTAIYYAFCDASDCTQPGTWQDSPIYGPLEGRTVTADYASLVFDGDKPRVITRLNLSGLPVGVNYHQCDQDCNTRDSWNSVELPNPNGIMWTNWDLALDAQGRPRIALYEPATIDITVGGKLYYGWCDTDCGNGDAPFQLVQVASGEGKSVDLAIDAQGRTHMVYDAGQRGTLGELWCDTGCTDANQWQRRILETNEKLMEEFKPASPFHCDQPDEQRAWLDAIPTVDFDPQSRLVVAYDVKNVVTCYYRDPTKPNDPPQSRVERLWWAVRWAVFPQP